MAITAPTPEEIEFQNILLGKDPAGREFGEVIYTETPGAEKLTVGKTTFTLKLNDKEKSWMGLSIPLDHKIWGAAAKVLGNYGGKSDPDRNYVCASMIEDGEERHNRLLIMIEKDFFQRVKQTLLQGRTLS